MAQVDYSIDQAVRIRTSRAGLSIFGAKGSSLAAVDGFRGSTKMSESVFTELLAFYPPACILDVNTEVEDGESYICVQVHPRQVLSLREVLGPQMPYLDVAGSKMGIVTANPGAASSESSSDEEAGGVGLDVAKKAETDDYEQALANAYPWLRFGEMESAEAMQSLIDAIEKHTGGVDRYDDVDAFAARRCYDPAVLAFWTSTPGSRVVRHGCSVALLLILCTIRVPYSAIP